MGIASDVMQLMEIGREALGTPSFKGRKICEFGCQKLRRASYPKDSFIRSCHSSKEYFDGMGADHISIDLNGRMGHRK